MYGPVATQMHVGQWEHDALTEARRAHRWHSDSDHLKVIEQAYDRSAQVRLIAAAASVLVALVLIVLI
jgi:hypothetical protein